MEVVAVDCQHPQCGKWQEALEADTLEMGHDRERVIYLYLGYSLSVSRQLDSHLLQ